VIGCWGKFWASLNQTRNSPVYCSFTVFRPVYSTPVTNVLEIFIINLNHFTFSSPLPLQITALEGIESLHWMKSLISFHNRLISKNFKYSTYNYTNDCYCIQFKFHPLNHSFWSYTEHWNCQFQHIKCFLQISLNAITFEITIKQFFPLKFMYCIAPIKHSQWPVPNIFSSFHPSSSLLLSVSIIIVKRHTNITVMKYFLSISIITKYWHLLKIHLKIILTRFQKLPWF
jgi:hypothetical protein